MKCHCCDQDSNQFYQCWKCGCEICDICAIYNDRVGDVFCEKCMEWEENKNGISN